MARRFQTLLLLTGMAMLAGCVTPVPPVSVTRFNRIDAATPLAPGSYVVRGIAAPGSAPDSPVGLPDTDYAAAVSSQLDRLGFRPVAADQGADYIVSLGVEHDVLRAAQRQGSGVNVGVGGGVSSGGYYSGSGVGLGVGLDLNRLFGGRPRDTIATRLTVRIARPGQTPALWEGRADSSARQGTPAAQPGIDAAKLADALFRDFPGRSGETITVP